MSTANPDVFPSVFTKRWFLLQLFKPSKQITSKTEKVLLSAQTACIALTGILFSNEYRHLYRRKLGFLFSKKIIWVHIIPFLPTRIGPLKGKLFSILPYCILKVPVYVARGMTLGFAVILESDLAGCFTGYGDLQWSVLSEEKVCRGLSSVCNRLR